MTDCVECDRLRRENALLREALPLAAAWAPERAAWCEWPANRRNVERLRAVMRELGVGRGHTPGRRARPEGPT